MKKIMIIFVFLSTALIIGFIFSFSRHSSHGNYVILGGKTLSVEVVYTPAALEKGLSGHAPLSDTQGMLFVFAKPGRYGFWMKDMTFPLDIIWISDRKATASTTDSKIVHIEKSLSPATYPHIFYSPDDAQYVLEVAAGQSDNLHLKIGDTVQIFKK